jgi:hypothetical protein
LSADTVAQLQGRFGAKFETASEVEKLALVTASTEGEVTHARLKSMCDAHARDVTVALAQLVQRGLLEKSGKQKQTIYFLPGDTPPVELPSLFDRPGRAGAPSLQGSDGSSQHSDWSSQHSDGSSQHSRPSLQRTEVSPPAGKLSGTSGSVDPPADAASVDRWAELERLAQPFREKRRLSPKAMEALLLRICTGTFVSIAELARLTGRTVDTLRNHVLKRLVADRKLLLRYPETPTHPYQGYTAAEGDR